MPFVFLEHEGLTKRIRQGKKRLTSEGKDEDTYGDDPWHSAVALPKLVHQILEKHTQALEGPIGADLHHEEGHSHSPTPATIRHLWVNIWAQATQGIEHRHGYRWSPTGRNRSDISEFSSWLINHVIKTFSSIRIVSLFYITINWIFWFRLSVGENKASEDVTLGSKGLFVLFYYILQTEEFIGNNWQINP